MQFDIRLVIFLEIFVVLKLSYAVCNSIVVASYTNINANLQEKLFSMFVGAYRLTTINNVPLCTYMVTDHPGGLTRGTPGHLHNDIY